MKYFETLIEDQETTISILYDEQIIKVYSSVPSTIQNLIKILGQPTTKYKKSKTYWSGASWNIDFFELDKIQSILIRDIFIDKKTKPIIKEEKKKTKKGTKKNKLEDSKQKTTKKLENKKESIKKKTTKKEEITKNKTTQKDKIEKDRIQKDALKKSTTKKHKVQKDIKNKENNISEKIETKLKKEKKQSEKNKTEKKKVLTEKVAIKGEKQAKGKSTVNKKSKKEPINFEQIQFTF